MNKPVYVLGTGLSHNGSAVLLKDGVVSVGIEKERLSRIKHDGGNDTLAVEYCLAAEGIDTSDIDLVVQCANFEIPDRNRHLGLRPWAHYPEIPLVSISHHLAHAYSTVGTCPYETFDVLVIDGCGSPYDQCTDLPGHTGMYDRMHCEKDSFYRWDGQRLHTLWKDFSEMDVPAGRQLALPTTRHSIGGFYAVISDYCFGNMDDAGKLMGLAPYGQGPALDVPAFSWQEDRLLVLDEWKELLRSPAAHYDDFRERFQYFADMACWAQQQVEFAVTETIRLRHKEFGRRTLSYTGGVALNAVANGKLLRDRIVDSLYLEPAAGDNGLALGCAYYGWLQQLGMARKYHDGSTAFGKTYPPGAIEEAVNTISRSGYSKKVFPDVSILIDTVADHLDGGRTVGWFQAGSEFGPRALGHRSILAHPGRDGLRDHINHNIKFREDFRPFAPAVMEEEVNRYFEQGLTSPYMILVDRVRPEWKQLLGNVIHVDGSARVQTVKKAGDPLFHRLLDVFRERSGLGMLLNTSFNRRGQPIVERPDEALSLFQETALDVLVIGRWLVEKPHQHGG